MDKTETTPQKQLRNVAANVGFALLMPFIGLLLIIGNIILAALALLLHVAGLLVGAGTFAFLGYALGYRDPDHLMLCAALGSVLAILWMHTTKSRND